MLSGLLSDANLIFPNVYFDSNGRVLCSADNSQIILREEPPFGHHFLNRIINLFVFTGRPSMATVAPERFNPMPLEMLAFAATMAHFALKNINARTRQPFCSEDYAREFDEYLDRAREYSDNEPEACLTLQVKLWEDHYMKTKGRMPEVTSRARKSTKGLSKADVAAQLAKLRPQPGPPHIASASASASSSVGPHGAPSATAQSSSLGVPGQAAPHTQYMMHYPVPYGYPAPHGYGPGGMPQQDWSGPPHPPPQ